MTNFIDYYRLLGVPAASTPEQISQRYQILRRQIDKARDGHDRVSGVISQFCRSTGRQTPETSASSMEYIDRAFEVLTTDRRTYNQVYRDRLSKPQPRPRPHLAGHNSAQVQRRHATAPPRPLFEMAR